MYFVVFLTEHCNLECSYCETHTSRSVRTQEIQYSLDQLVDFLGRDPHLSLQFYGGEPLPRLDLIAAILVISIGGGFRWRFDSSAPAGASEDGGSSGDDGDTGIGIGSLGIDGYLGTSD